jgi:nucleotide-binding universal stress UspA family protein
VYRRVLLATDGSEISRAALPHAERVLAHDDGELHLLEVVDAIPEDVEADLAPARAGARGEVHEMAVEEARREYARAQRHLAALQDELRQRGVPRVVTAVRAGIPEDVIPRYARECGCDLVVMGTHGRTGLHRAIRGSVADAVVHRLEGIPVLLVHPAGPQGGKRG